MSLNNESVYKFEFQAKGQTCAVELHHVEGCWRVIVEDQVQLTLKHKKLNPFSAAREVMAFTRVFQAYPDGALKCEVIATWSITKYKWEYACSVEGQEVPLSWSNHRGMISQKYPVIIAADEAIVPAVQVQQLQDEESRQQIEQQQQLLREMNDRLKAHEDRSINLERQLSLTVRENDLLSKKVFAMEAEMHASQAQPIQYDEGYVKASAIPSMVPRGNLMKDKGVAMAPMPRPAGSQTRVPAAFVLDFENSWIGAATRALEGVLNMIPEDFDMVPATTLGPAARGGSSLSNAPAASTRPPASTQLATGNQPAAQTNYYNTMYK